VWLMSLQLQTISYQRLLVCGGQQVSVCEGGSWYLFYGSHLFMEQRHVLLVSYQSSVYGTETCPISKLSVICLWNRDMSY
jgi:hypothetical protein